MHVSLTRDTILMDENDDDDDVCVLILVIHIKSENIYELVKSNLANTYT